MRSSHLTFVVVACLVVVSATLACSAIIGLDSFDKVPCDACVEGDAGEVVDGSDEAAAPPDAQLGDVESNPAVWASWPMPNPAVDAGPDAAPWGNFVQYMAVQGTVQEQLTQLTWSLMTTQGVSQTAAVAYCASLKDQGQKWRLPSRIELVTLIDFTRTPYVDPIFTGAVKGSRYWTSSVDRTNVNNYWTVDFGSGVVATGDQSAQSNAVICVTGGKARQ